MKAIELRRVSFSYDGFEDMILNNVNLSVDYGEVALLSGLSGEGKSTILSIISGIIPNIISGKILGEVLVNGKSVAGESISKICRQVGIILQNADNQIIHKIVEDEIAFGCENFAIPQNKIEEQIERVCKIMHLEKEMETRLLSGGQKQRLITASTLATGQRILILDEPLANLDKESSIFLMKTLKSLAQAGYAVLLIEHRLDMVVSFVDTVWNICSGQITKIEDKKEYIRQQTLKIMGDSPSMKGQLLFDIKHVGFSTKKKEILKDIHLSIYKGERLLLLGENGCGKTTLLRLLARLYKPSKGYIEQFLYPKMKNWQTGKKWFKEIGFVYQNPNYQLFMPTVEQEIAYNAVSKMYAEEMIQLFGLENLRFRHPQSLSEGQKRRVSIAAIVAGNPKVLLLDEPTVGQDYQGLCDLTRILEELHQKSGNTMITITHDIRCAEAFCDRAVIIEDGKVKAEGDRGLVREYFSENI